MIRRLDAVRSGPRLRVPTNEAAVPKPQPVPEVVASAISDIYPGMHMFFSVENVHVLPELA